MALKLLIIHPDDPFRRHLSERLRLENYQVVESAPETESMAALKDGRFDVILLRTTGLLSGRLSVLKSIKETCPGTEVILLTTQDEHTLTGSIQAMRMGAFDELIVPLDIGTLHRRIQDAHVRQKERVEAERSRG